VQSVVCILFCDCKREANSNGSCYLSRYVGMRLVVKFYFYFCFNLFRSSSVFVRRVILHFFLQGTAFFFFSLYIVLTSWVIMVRASH